MFDVFSEKTNETDEQFVNRSVSRSFRDYYIKNSAKVRKWYYSAAYSLLILANVLGLDAYFEREALFAWAAVFAFLLASGFDVAARDLDRTVKMYKLMNVLNIQSHIDAGEGLIREMKGRTTTKRIGDAFGRAAVVPAIFVGGLIAKYVIEHYFP